MLRVLTPYLQIIRWHKPIGSFLLLWPTLIALYLAADGHPSYSLIVIFSLGVFVMRSAGCIVNDFADRHIDGRVERTKERPLVSGQLSVLQAWVFFSILLVLAFVLVCLTNRMTIALSVGALFLAVLYPFTKRFFAMPQLILGAAFGSAVPMAFAAQSEQLPLSCWLLFIATLLWAMAYDTVYAMVDRSDDQKIGVLSSAIFAGKWDTTLIAVSQIGMMIAYLWIGQYYRMNVFYYVGWSLAALYMAFLQWQIKERCPKKCFKAFLNHNWVGFILLLSVLLGFERLGG